MTRILSMFFIVAALGLSACVTDGPKDAGGTVMSLSDPKSLATDQTDLNIALWIDQRLMADIQRTIRDNDGINERMNLRLLLGSGTGNISTQRVPDGFFSLRTAEDIDNVEQFKTLVEQRLKSLGVASQQAPVKIDNKKSYRTAGYKTVATLVDNKGYCFVARAAFRFGMLSSYTNERGSPDTVMNVIYCKPTRDFPEFDRLMAEVGVMKPEEAAQIRTMRAPRGA